MFVLNTIVQVWAVIAGIIVVFKDGLLKGIALIASVFVLHFLTSAATNGILYLHQKTLSQEELRNMSFMVQRCRG